MRTEKFTTCYLFAPVDVEIDIEDGEILHVYHQGTDMLVHIPEPMLTRFNEDTAHIRMLVVNECLREAGEYERHCREESSQEKFV